MSVQAIPASYTAQVNPGVISAGGAALQLQGLALTANTRVPIGTVLSLPTLAAAQAYFGANSTEAAFAAVYFLGYTGRTAIPAALLFSQYPTATNGVPAYLQGAQLGLTLAQLNALPTGTIIVTINGTAWTSSTIDLTAVGSFSAAATAIQTALAAKDASFTAAISTTNMTVSAVSAGTLAPGQIVAGGGVTAGTTIVSQTSGPVGGTGVYVVSASQTVSSAALTSGAAVVTYDSVSGAFVITGGTPGAASTIGFATGTLSASLKLTSATGAVTSQGAAGNPTPAAAMSAIVSQSQNWATFTTLGFKPSIPNMIAFAAWTNTTNDQYAYVMWDTDASVTTNADTASAGYAIIAANYSGTFPVYESANTYVAAFVMGTIASVDFTRTNGRITLKFRSQTGLVPSVTTQTIAAQLTANGYSYYGANANATNLWNYLAEGSITGPFVWADAYINQQWMNAAFQTALMTLLTQSNSIPYTPAGNAQIESALLDPINAAVNFGAVTPNVPLSALQAAEVNTAAGLPIDGILSTRGWYLQVKTATPLVRAARGSPPCTFWYTDGGSVHRINLASLLVQ